MSVVITARDMETIQLVARLGMVTARQVQLVGYEPASQGKSCQRRLKELVDAHWLDVVPGRKANEPARYWLTGKAVNGVALLRTLWGVEQTQKYLKRRAAGEHTLAISELAVRVMRGCKELGFTLRSWTRSEELAPLLQSYRLIPDAYWEISREMSGATVSSYCFLEMERSVKGVAIIRSKLERYRQLIYQSDYARVLGTEIRPRVLFVFTQFAGVSAAGRIAYSARVAESLQVRCARFAGLETIQALPPAQLLTAPIWRLPADSPLQPLYELGR